MKSALLSNQAPEPSPNEVFMVFLPDKKRYWPVKFLSVTEHHPRTKKPIKGKFQVFDTSKSPYKYMPTKIELDFSHPSPSQLIPFKKIFADCPDTKKIIDSKNYSKKDSLSYEKVMEEARQVFETNCKSANLYLKLKEQSKIKAKIKDSKNQGLFNLTNQQKKVRQKQKEINSESSRESKSFKISENPSTKQKSQIIKIEEKTPPKAPNTIFVFSPENSVEENLELVMKAKSFVSSSDQFENTQNDIKRSRTQAHKNEDSLKSLEKPKKKRKASQKTITASKQESSAQSSKVSKAINVRQAKKVSTKMEQEITKKANERKSRIFQVKIQDASKEKSNQKKNETKGKNGKAQSRAVKNRIVPKRQPAKSKKLELPKQTKGIIPNMVSQKQIIKNQHQTESSCYKSSICSNVAQANAKSKGKNLKNVTQVHKQPLIEKNREIKVKIELSASEKSVVSNRTRSKKIMNSNVVDELPPARLNHIAKQGKAVKPKLKVTQQIRIAKNQSQSVQVQKKRARNCKDQKLPISSSLFLPLKVPLCQPASYLSENGRKLNVESGFAILETLFQNHPELIKYAPKKRIYCSIMSERKATEIEKKLQLSQNLTQKIDIQLQEKSYKKQEQSFEETLLKKDEEETEACDQYQENQKASCFNQRNKEKSLTKNNKIIEQKDKKFQQKNQRKNLKIQQKVKDQQLSISFEDFITGSTQNTNIFSSVVGKSHQQRIALQHQLHLISGYDDIFRLIKMQIESRSQNGKDGNEMDLQRNNFENPLNEQKVFIFVVEKDSPHDEKTLPQNSKASVKKRKSKKIKKAKNSKKKILMSKENLLQQSHQKIEQSVVIWTISQFFFHSLWASLKNLCFSIGENPGFKNDMEEFKEKHQQFLKSVFSRIDLNESESESPTHISKKSSRSLKSKHTTSQLPNKIQNKRSNSCQALNQGKKNKKISQSKQNLPQTNKNCNHKLCLKFMSDQENIEKKLLLQIHEILMLSFPYPELVQEYKFYSEAIKMQAENIFHLFEKHPNDKKSNKKSQNSKINTFKIDCFRILSKSFHENTYLGVTQCFYSRIFHIIINVLDIFSEHQIKFMQFLQDPQLNQKSQLAISEMIQEKPSKRSKTKKNLKTENNHLKEPFKHPNKKRLAQVATSPFTIKIDSDHSGEDLQKSESRQLSSSAETKFSRNTTDFSSFLTSIIKNVDIETHKRNFRKGRNEQKIGESYHTVLSRSQCSAFQQYSEKIPNSNKICTDNPQKQQQKRDFFWSGLMKNNEKGTRKSFQPLENIRNNEKVGKSKIQRNKVLIVQNSMQSCAGQEKERKIQKENETQYVKQIEAEIYEMLQRMLCDNDTCLRT